MKRFSLLLAPLLLTVVPACDQTGQDERAEAPRAALDDEDDDALSPPSAEHHGKHGKRGKHGEHALERLCSAVECTDAQRTQLTALLPQGRDHRAGGPQGDEKSAHGDRQAAHKKLADAFRGEQLDTQALADLGATMDAHHAERRASMTQALVQAHGILTAEQRGKAADMVDAFVPKMMEGRGGEARQGRVAERICAAVQCQGDQATSIEAALNDARPEPNADEVAATKRAVGDALRADTLDANTVEAIMDRFDAMKQGQKPRIEAMLSEIHAILSPEQRTIVADLLQTKGPRALMGGGRGGKHRGGKHGGKRRHGGGENEAPQAG